MTDGTPWLDTEMAAWRNVAQQAEEYCVLQASGRTILFRGQPKAWPLRSSLARALPIGTTDDAALKAERAALEHFMSQAHLHGPVPDRSTSATHRSLFEWWPLMQHHGAPTRLLDWTASPFVAAYFAASAYPDDDGVVFVLDSDKVMERYLPVFGEALSDAELFALSRSGLRTLTPERKSLRLVAQQGYFTVTTLPLADTEKLISEAGAALRRLIIPAKLKPTVLMHLRTMNIGAHTLFAGMDGLGRSAGELLTTSL